MKSICFYNHKGGVGKTTMTAAVAGELVAAGKKAVVIDTDSQSNLTEQLSEGNVAKELADYLYDSTDGIEKIILETKYPGLYLVPSRKLSAGGRLEKWARSEATEAENRNAVKNFVGRLCSFGFDFALFDMPPSYSELDKQILLACDEVVPVLQLDKYSIDGLSDFFLLLDRLKGGDEKPELKRLVFNQHQRTKAVQKALLPEIENLRLSKYLVPNDELFKKAAFRKQLVQAMSGLKKETNDVLEKIAKDLIEGQ